MCITRMLMLKLNGWALDYICSKILEFFLERKSSTDYNSLQSDSKSCCASKIH